MSGNMLIGERVRLAAPDENTDAPAFQRWSRDSEYARLLSTRAARPSNLEQARHELDAALNDHWFLFAIRALADDRLLGIIDLDVDYWAHRNAWMGIALGERADWGQGYGADALRLGLRFAFTELNLERISLTVFEYNQRAIRSYEKAGFVHEGGLRGHLHRDGRRWDLRFMGILRDEWEQKRER